MSENNAKELVITRVLDAPVEKVWQAWTDPMAVQRWWGPAGVTNPTCEWDAKPGGEINIVMLAGPELGPLAGQEWPMRGEFKEVEPSKRLVFINQAVDKDGNILIDGLTTVEFEQIGSKTKLTVTTVATPTTPAAEQMIAGMSQGWNQQLDKLTELVK